MDYEIEYYVSVTANLTKQNSKQLRIIEIVALGPCADVLAP